MQGEFTPETTPDVIALIEAIARGLDCTTGTWTLEFRVEGGRYKVSYLKRGPINDAGLAAMFEWPSRPSAGRDAPC